MKLTPTQRRGIEEEAWRIVRRYEYPANTTQFNWWPPEHVKVGDEAVLHLGYMEIRVVYRGDGLWTEPDWQHRLVERQVP